MDLINWHYGKTTTNALNIRKAPSLSAQRWNNVWPVARVALIKPAYTPDWYEKTFIEDKKLFFQTIFQKQIFQKS